MPHRPTEQYSVIQVGQATRPDSPTSTLAVQQEVQVHVAPLPEARRSDLAETISDADELGQFQHDHLSQIHISLRWSTIEPRTRPHVHSNDYVWMRFLPRSVTS